MTNYSNFKLAAIQAAPVYFDLEASTEKACGLIREAGDKGATIAAFGETWLPGYPFHVWLQPSPALNVTLRAEYIANAVEIPSPTTDRLCSAAKEANLDVVIGVAERDKTTQGTIYCTLLFISNEGDILGWHRKLKPTDRERTIFGEGDASGLIVYERPYGRISGLNCWEHKMVLPGYALMSAGTQIHIAAWPGESTCNHKLLSAAFAAQSAAYVIDVGGLQSERDLPEAYKELEKSFIELDREMHGESHIFGPYGDIVAGPAQGETILVADCSSKDIHVAKSYCDNAGHYSRPDIFDLTIDRSAHRRPVNNNNDRSQNEQKKPDEE